MSEETKLKNHRNLCYTCIKKENCRNSTLLNMERVSVNLCYEYHSNYNPNSTRSQDVAEAIGEIDKQIEACTTFMAKGNNAFTQLGALNQLTKIKKLLEVKTND